MAIFCGDHSEVPRLGPPENDQQLSQSSINFRNSFLYMSVLN